MKFSPKTPVILSLAFLTAACSATKDMDNMSKQTSDMSNKTSAMADNTSHLSATNDTTLGKISTLTDLNTHMAGTTDSLLTATNDTKTAVQQTKQATLDTKTWVQQSAVTSSVIATGVLNTYTEGRQAAMAENRKKLFLPALDKAGTVEDKADNAGAYFQAFEYQLWKNAGPDSPEKLDALYRDALQEFTDTLTEYLPNQGNKIYGQPIDLKKMLDKNNPSLNTDEDLLALSASVDQINTDATPGTLSMLALIEQALPLSKKLESGQIQDTPAAPLKEWQRVVMRNYDQLVFFIQVRENYLASLCLGQISDIATANDARLLVEIIGGWSPDLTHMNMEQIGFCAGLVNEANNAATFLGSMGEATKVDANLNKFVGRMKPITLTDKSARSQITGALDAAIEGFASIK